MSGYSTAGSILDIGDAFFGRAFIAVVGCGGKTTFINKLGKELSNKKVLITPTTKIYLWREKAVALCTTMDECNNHKPQAGLQCLGILDEKNKKISSLPLNMLEEMVREYDIVLMEADGARGLYCKGWNSGEPVIPNFCTHTVGIVTLKGINKPADDKTVHRLSEFLKLTGLKKGEQISLQAIRRMICDEKGMFKNSAVKTYLFVNQVENDADEEKAVILLNTIKKYYPGRFSGLAYGSALSNKWKKV